MEFPNWLLHCMLHYTARDSCIRDSNLLNLSCISDALSLCTVCSVYVSRQPIRQRYFQQFGQCGNQAKYFISNISRVYRTDGQMEKEEGRYIGCMYVHTYKSQIGSVIALSVILSRHTCNSIYVIGYTVDMYVYI